MKKYKLIMTVVSMLFMLAMLSGCGAAESVEGDAIGGTEKKTADETESTTSMSKIENEDYTVGITEDGVNYFEATVTEVNEGSLMVKPNDKYFEAKSYNKMTVTNMFSHEVKVGDVITVYYDGLICEISPPFPNTIYGMTMLDENGELIIAYSDETPDDSN